MVNTLVGFIYNVVLYLIPFVVTAFLAFIAFKVWLHYIQQDFISGITWVVLEVVPPREVLRSPKAMELFLTNALYHKSRKGGLEEYWQGAVWFWYSLEIVSIEGQVHFYIRVPTRIRPLVETQMYAQYPQAQVREVEDYTLAVDGIYDDKEKGTSKYNMWGCEFKLDKPDGYPIKTYVDFGLDKDPKEEFKVDPISPVIEFFSSIGKGEQLWLQFVVRHSRKKYKTKGTHFKTHDWVIESQEEMKRELEPYTGWKERPDGTIQKEIRAPSFMDNVVKGMSNKMMKVGFDVGVRTCYVAERQIFNHNVRKSLRLIFRQYANPLLNSFERFNSTQPDAFAGNLFQSFFLASKATVRRLSDRMLHEYREREFFYPPLRHKIHFPWPISPFIFPNYFHHKTCLLNAEELATLWHFPGQILKVPTLERIESKEAAPPTNLPS